MKNRIIVTTLIANGLLLASSVPSLAQTQWTNTLGGDWATGGNWSAGVPDSADAVTFVNGTYSITSSTAAMSASTVSTSSGQLVTFNLGAGNALTVSGVLGLTVNEDTSLTSGAINPSQLLLGFGASNSDFVIDGSLASMLTSAASVGRSSTTPTNGNTNTLTIQNGADFTLNTGILSIGFANTAAQANSNILTVTGTGSTLAANAGIAVGNLNNGTTNAQANSNSLVVDNGGVVTTTFLSVGRRSTGALATAAGNTVTVGGTGTGSSLTATGVVTIGQVAGNNVLTVNSGGTVTATSAATTLANFATNRLRVNGGTYYATGQTITVPRNTQISLEGNGTLTANQIDVDGAFGNGAADGDTRTFSSGTLNVTTMNQTWNAYTFHVGNNSGAAPKAIYNMTGNGNHSFATAFTVDESDGQLSGTGALLLVGGGSLPVTNNGIIAPGATGGGTGMINVTGNLSSGANAVYNLDLTSLASFDQLNMSGTAAYSGTLNVSLLGGYMPSLGDTFDLFDFISATGTFTNLNLPSLGAGKQWNTANLYTTGEISVVAAGGSPYDTWASGTFTNAFTDTLPGSDPDNDGLKNLLEFVLGGDPTVSQSTIIPVVATSTSNLVLTFSRSDESETDGVSVTVQTSPDLATWSDDTLIGAANGSGPNGITYTVTESVDPATLDTVVVTIPKGVATNKFARLVANK